VGRRESRHVLNPGYPVKFELVTSSADHEPALSDFVRGFVTEAGYYLGREATGDGGYSLAGVTDVPVVNQHRMVAMSGGRPAGFVDFVPEGEGRQANTLSAIYVAPELRRKRLGALMLRMLFTRRPGTWCLDLPLRFGPAVGFFEAGLVGLASGGDVSVQDFQRDGSSFRRLGFYAAPPFVTTRSGPGLGLPSSGHLRLGLAGGFPFDRSHHVPRARLLWAAVFIAPAAMLTAMVLGTENEGLAMWLHIAGIIASAVFLVLYIEEVVTGILDRLDRGPICEPVVRAKPESIGGTEPS